MKNLLLALLIMVLPVAMTAQSLNDNCSDATTLQINTGLEPTLKTAGSIVGATVSPEANYCSTQSRNDVWFKFVATSTTHQISLLDITGSSTNLDHTVYKGNDCGTMSQMFCSDPNNSSASGLIIGETYKIRIYSAITTGIQNILFNVSITTPATIPSNDNCENAITLIVNPPGIYTETVSSTLYNATNSNTGAPCSTAEDVWFKFVATGTQHKLTSSNISGSIDEIRYSVYHNNCNGNNMISCNLSVNNILQGLTVGETYMIKVQSWEGVAAAPSGFTICLTDITPANDHCPSAVTLTPSIIPNCTSPVSGNLINTSPSTVMSGCGMFYNDLWYNFTATNATHYIWLTKTAGTGDIQFDLFKGDDCSTLTHISCSSNNPEYNSFIPGQVYKIRVYTNYFNDGNLTFNICLGTKAIIPANDNCSGAKIIIASTTSQCTDAVSGTIAGATASPESNNSCGGSADDDVWFEFVATSAKHTINITNISGTTTELYSTLYSNYNCEFLMSSAICYYSNTKYIFNCEVGETYKLRIYSYTSAPNQTTTFDVCITTPPAPPANDNCDSAINLSISPTMDCGAEVIGTTESATASTAISTCGGGGNMDVWYKFTATSNRHIVKCTTDSGANILTSLYTANCAVPTVITCSANMFENLTPGQTYMVRLMTSTTVNFTICISTPPLPAANDACANAVTLPVNEGTNPTLLTPGVISWATSSPEGSACITFNQKQQDVWYQFTATSSIHQVILKFADTNLQGKPNLDVGIYKGTDCNTMSLVQCSSEYPTDGVYNNFIPGETYKIRVYKTIGTSPVYNDFAISIVTMPAPPINDLCTNATLLPVTPGQTCMQSIHGSLTSSTYTTIPVNGTSNDIWYEFTATHTIHNLYVTNISNINTQFIKIELFDGTCGSLVYKNTYLPTISPVITDLIPGNTYKIRLFNQQVILASVINSFDICLTEPHPTPVNDECNAAITIPVNSGLTCNEFTTGTVKGSTLSSNSITNTIAYKSGDVWYKFTATATKHLITITSDDIFLSHAVYSGTDCNALTLLYYQETSGVLNSIANNLTIGQVYTIRILRNTAADQNTDFNVCILTPVPASNDECANAIVLTVNSGSNSTEYSEASFHQATHSPEPGECTSGVDLWYKFTATATLHQISMTGGYLNVALFEANSCDEITCNSNITPQNNGYVNNLTVGKTYLIKLLSSNLYNGNPNIFRIAVNTPAPPANDECANATVTYVNESQDCVTKYTGDLINSTISPQAFDCTSIQRDIWIEFTATSNYHTITNLSNNENIKTGYTIYQGDSCNLSTLYCGESAYTATYAFIAGEKYKIRVYAKYAENYNSLPVEICITTPISCSNPEPFVSGYNKYVFSGANRIPAIYNVGCFVLATNVKWFSIKITNPGDIEYQISLNQSFDPYGIPTGLNINDFKYSVWGPFDNMTQGCENLSPSNILRCNSITDGSPGSFSLSGAQTGKYYVVMVGHNKPINLPWDAFIKFEQTGGTSSTGPLQPPSGNSNQAFAEGQTLADIEIDTPNDGTIIWYDTPGQELMGILTDNDTNPSTDTPIPLDTPLIDGATYYAAYAIYGVESTQRLAVTVGSAPETPAPTGETQQLFTVGETLADLEINGQNIKWYNNENATVSLPLNTLLTDGTSYAASQSINGLESINRLTVTATYYEAPAPTGPAEQTFTNGQTLANLEIQGDNVKWYAGETGTNTLVETTPLADNTTYYATQTLNGIESLNRLAITAKLIFTETSAPTGPAEQTFTNGETLADLEIQGENIKWYASETGTNTLVETTQLADNTTYYATQTLNGIESISRLAIIAKLLIIETPSPIGPAEQTFTDGETLANLEIQGENIKWYANETGINALVETTPLTDNTTYYATQTLNGIESISKLAVTTKLILGDNDSIFTELQYYPNPVVSIFTITNTTIDHVRIVNIVGQQILFETINAERADIDMSHLSAGIYIVKIESAGKTKSLKIIKE